MSNSKLTDIEIPNVKELLEYKAKAHCELCDLKHLDCCNVCIYTAIKQFIELFNRLQAENERLKNDIIGLNSMIELKKETTANLIIECNKLVHQLETAKAEAYKEFAEKMKGVIPGIDDTYIESFVEDYIDNLLKEMEGEDNAKEKE